MENLEMELLTNYSICLHVLDMDINETLFPVLCHTWKQWMYGELLWKYCCKNLASFTVFVHLWSCLFVLI